MKIKTLALLLAAVFLSGGCGRSQNSASTPAAATGQSAPESGQSAVVDDESQKDIVKVAAGSAAHSTLVAAVKAAGLVDVLSNTGPFTVFAPVNEAFDKLPAGTVGTLLKPENKDRLADILQYHVAVAVYREEMLTDGRVINMANGGDIRISRKDGKVIVNDSATVVGSALAANGIIYILDGVLLPPDAK